MAGIYEEYGDLIATLRREGRTLQQIGDRLGVTRERVRQVLREHFPDCQPPPSSQGAARTLGMSYHQFRSVAERLGIRPIGRSVGKIWRSPHVLGTIGMAQEGVRCRICGGSLPSTRRVYCSKSCYSAGKALNQRMRKQREAVGLLYVVSRIGTTQ